MIHLPASETKGVAIPLVLPTSEAKSMAFPLVLPVAVGEAEGVSFLPMFPVADMSFEGFPRGIEEPGAKEMHISIIAVFSIDVPHPVSLL
jgi:hypothetical protein